MSAMRATFATDPIAADERPFDAGEAVAQVGRMNLLAVSGGRVLAEVVDGGCGRMVLPVAHGYRVEVTLRADDTYRVSRVFRRGGRQWNKATWSGVYCDQLGETVYRASCYLDDPVGADQ